MNLLAQIDQLVAALGLESDEEKIKENLLTAVFLNFIARFSQNSSVGQASKNLLSKKLTDYKKFEKEFLRIVKSFGKDNNSEKILKSALSEVLEYFVSQLQPKPSLQKLAEVKKIISGTL